MAVCFRCWGTGEGGEAVLATDGVAEKIKELESKAAAKTALPPKKDFILLGSPSEVNSHLSAALRASPVRFRGSTSSSRSHFDVSWSGVASLMRCAENLLLKKNQACKPACLVREASTSRFVCPARMDSEGARLGINC